MSCTSCQALAERVEVLAESEQRQKEIANSLQLRVNGLKAALSASHTEGDFGEEVQSVYQLWREVCDHSRAELGPKRATAVKARLAGSKTLEDLRWAVMGAGQFRYTSSGGQRVRVGEKADRWDDLELICRNEINVEKFMGLADDHARYVFDRAVSTLVHAYGQVLTPVDDDPSAGWYSPCPCHDVSLADLRVLPGSAEVGRWLDLRCLRGCGPDDVLEALRELARPRLVAA